MLIDLGISNDLIRYSHGSIIFLGVWISYVKKWVDCFSLIQFTLLQRDRVINCDIYKKTI